MWAFAARFLFILGYFVVFAFQLYILTYFVGLPMADANSTIGLLSLAGLASTIISVSLGGWWSDRVGKRKVFIYAASVFMLLGLVFPILMPNVTGMIIMGAINGFGFGLYMACDTALMTEVLPGGWQRRSEGPRDPQRGHQHPAGHEPRRGGPAHRIIRRLSRTVRLRHGRGGPRLTRAHTH